MHHLQSHTYYSACLGLPLNSSLKHYTPSRTLRSSLRLTLLLFVPRVRRPTCFGSRSFAVSAPTIWNSLPLAIHSSFSTYSFRRQLKSFFYNLAFPAFLFLNAPLHPAPQIRRVSPQHCALYKFTYLLTKVKHLPLLCNIYLINENLTFVETFSVKNKNTKYLKFSTI